MKKNHAVIITLCLLVLTGLGTYGFTYLMAPTAQSSQSHDRVAYDYMRVDDFAFKTITGQETSMAALEGKIVLLHFWATWCAPCVVEFPHLKDLTDAMQDDLVLVAVSADGKQEAIDAFMQKTFPNGVGDNFLVVHDPMQKIIQERFQTYRLPETIIINPRGEMVEKVIGGNTQWGSDEMVVHLKKYQ